MAPASLPARRWRRWTACVLLMVMSLNACYASAPIAGRPAPETNVAFDLTDRGRAQYSQQIGSGTRSVEGTLESATDSAYVVRIKAVQGLDGRMVPWNGERMTFSPDYVTNMRQRQFSRTRTTLLTVAAVAGVAALFLAAKLVGGGADRSRDDPRPPVGEF